MEEDWVVLDYFQAGGPDRDVEADLVMQKGVHPLITSEDLLLPCWP